LTSPRIEKSAEKHGGSSYSSGLHSGRKAAEVLGEARLARLKAFKAEVDPGHLLNPGKVLGDGLVPTAVELAGAFEPLNPMKMCHFWTR